LRSGLIGREEMETFLNILLSGILLGGIYALVSVGLNLIFGVVRIVNFAQGEFVMLAMYATFFCVARLGIGPYYAVFLVAPLMFVLGVVVQRLVLQPLQNEPMMQIFATFGLLILFENAVLAVTRGEGLSLAGTYSRSMIDLFGLQASVARVVVFLAATAITLALTLFLQHTMAGKAIRAVIQDRQSARLMGINVSRTYLLTFGLGAALAGVAGALLAPIYTLSPHIGGNFILPAFAVVVLGGLGSVPGAYIGGIAVGLMESFAGYYVDPALKQAIWFIIFVVVLVLKPSGLMGQAGAEEIGLREQS
jgi:branched-chain amino acid transport system permease protein